MPLRLLTIAGSDPSGGAGLQADLKTFAAHGAYGLSVVTAVTAQTGRELSAVHPLPPELVAAQLDAVLSGADVDGVKIGMLASAGIVRAVAGRLRAYLASPGRERGLPVLPVPVVVDPVMAATAGGRLLAEDAVAVLLDELLPLATLVTPNVAELERLSGLPAAGEEERRHAALALAARGPAVLAKGGHARAPAPGGPAAVEEVEVVDLLVAAGESFRFAHPRLPGPAPHGTGCTLASAVAVRLAAAEPLAGAVGAAIAYVQGAFAAAAARAAGGGGERPESLDHFYQLLPPGDERGCRRRCDRGP